MCFKATFHAMCEKFQLMHTGAINTYFLYSFILQLLPLLGSIHSKDLSDAKDKKERVVIYDKRIRF